MSPEISTENSPENTVMNITDIHQFIPHRYPFLLVDRVISYADKKLVALKNITINEPFLMAIFP